jgi:hypothetical protein
MTLSVDLCALDDYGELAGFIRDHWSASHVLARSRPLMDWQHRDDASKRYNFIAARDGEKGVVGILGFILASRYDPHLAADDDTLWLTTWKVRPDFAHGLGLVLLRKLDSMLAPKWIGTVGFNSAVGGIYKALGYHVGKLPRHYMLNDGITEFGLATVPPGSRHNRGLSSGASFKELDRASFFAASQDYDLDASTQVPRKTTTYIYSRYLLHPFYRYRAFLIVDEPHAGICVLRECSHESARAIRVVDYLGAPAALMGSGSGFRQILLETGAEYIDFFCSGLGPELAAAGFLELSATDSPGLILPGYFEPFERSNVELPYSLRGPDGLRIVCKGDADQDRPNMLQD